MTYALDTSILYEICREFHHTKSVYKESTYKKVRLYCPVVDVNEKIWNRAASI